MAVPDRKIAPTNMLKLELAIEDPLSNSHGEGAAAATTDHSFVSGAQSSHLPSPVTISRPLHDEYGARSSRESVLQRLSEALLRRSLTKVSSFSSLSFPLSLLFTYCQFRRIDRSLATKFNVIGCTIGENGSISE